jgi:hypothetical protein
MQKATSLSLGIIERMSSKLFGIVIMNLDCRKNLADVFRIHVVSNTDIRSPVVTVEKKYVIFLHLIQFPKCVLSRKA